MNEWKKIDKTIEVPLLGITVPNKDYAIGEIYISLYINIQIFTTIFLCRYRKIPERKIY